MILSGLKGSGNSHSDSPAPKVRRNVFRPAWMIETQSSTERKQMCRSLARGKVSVRRVTYLSSEASGVNRHPEALIFESQGKDGYSHQVVGDGKSGF